MSTIDKFLAKIYAGVGDLVEVPEEVTEQDIELVAPEKRREEHPFDTEVTKKRPHTIVPKEFIPDPIFAVPELSETLIPLAENILEKWNQKEAIETEIKAKKKELDEAIKQLKVERGYDLILKDLEETSQNLGEAISNIDTESNIVLRRFKEWFAAVAVKVEEEPQVLLSDTQRLEAIKAWIKGFDSNFSRSVTMRLRWLEKKQSIVTEKVKKFLRLFPIEEKKLTKKRSTIAKLITAIEEDVTRLLDSTYDDAVSILSGLYQLEESIEDSINTIMGY